ncbi:hypothetical protein AVEN_157352-1 [Araneus ventricosus]|uniref:Uncharacterized protein n=1 Tax=Araneus ventricosus TaxID=182803 RepID=A0A4Y2H0U3_ARAVE|nr:hypothetical protein AVEN_157352-1 [Araneus ventricosus]
MTQNHKTRELSVYGISRIHHVRSSIKPANGPYAPFGFESIKKQLWRNKQNDRPISDSEIKAVLSQLFKTGQWLPPAGHVSEDVTSHPPTRNEMRSRFGKTTYSFN